MHTASLFPFLLHHLLHPLHAHTPWHGPSLLHLLHHALNSLHPSNCSEHLRVHGLSHTLIHLDWQYYYLSQLAFQCYLSHFCWVQILDLFFILE